VSPIVWELGLVIVGVVGFAVWQFTTLKRDMRITRREREARESREGVARDAREPGSPGDSAS
jgi:hypothetical protein